MRKKVIQTLNNIVKYSHRKTHIRVKYKFNESIDDFEIKQFHRKHISKTHITTKTYKIYPAKIFFRDFTKETLFLMLKKGIKLEIYLEGCNYTKELIKRVKKLTKEIKEMDKMDKKRNIYVVSWDEGGLADIEPELKPGEKAVMRVCPDCLKDSDIFIPDEELYKYVTKGKKYKCFRCEKEIVE